MARNYSLRDFFRHMPKALLARYFAAKGQFSGLDFSAMKQTRPVALLNAWDSLADTEQRRQMEAEFREISALSDARGLQAILDEAAFHLSAADLDVLRDKLSSLSDHHSRAMVTFLDHSEVWKGALLFHNADSLPYWKSRKNLPRVTAAVDPTSMALLAERIKGFFRATDGRGRNCVVEPYRRGTRDYFFAYPEDHSDRGVEWVNGEFSHRPRNPAFEVVFVYSQDDGTLDINARGVGKGIEALQVIFARTILGLDDLPPDPKDGKVYDLSPLADRNFQFIRDATHGIGTVVVRRIRFSSPHRRGDRLILEADPDLDRQGIYRLMDEVGKAVPLQEYWVTQVELVADYASTGGVMKKKTIRITHPNMCSLKHDDIDERLRQMLVTSGIEPRSTEG
jgi:hypothetical protein